MEIKNSDGVQSSFFYFLWSKSRLSKRMRFRIPHTIMFEDGVPITWFFSGKNGNMLKKSSSNTNIQKIASHFKGISRKNKSGIAAYYIYNANTGFKSHQDMKGEEINYLKDVLENKGYVIHYFTFPMLCRPVLPSRFLRQLHKVPNWYPSRICGPFYHEKRDHKGILVRRSYFLREVCELEVPPRRQVRYLREGSDLRGV